MSNYEFNHYGSGDINVHIADKPAKTGAGGLFMATVGIGSMACISALMVEAAVAFITPLLPTIAGIAATGALGTVAIWQRRRIAPVIARLTPKRPEIAAPVEVQQIEAPEKPTKRVQEYRSGSASKALQDLARVTEIEFAE